ncbi:Histone-arginine methyltransferase CARMER [Smittium culicis]|uniref:type I protein arginine methyltransferase n=1 Tax=Smittium culicis TaxID=133412 RepID=A0A1R1XUL1_9FUNG|nr:Histone-arginine methyltransferase CARMER [Smittium culicis]
MLQDFVRTNTYRNAIINLSPEAIKNKIVMDVGAGSGILSYFAVQSGASKVYSIEASSMAGKMQKILDDANSNPNSKNRFLKDKIQIVKSKVEDIVVDIEKVDTIVSEPIGVLLVHERMLESYIYARDKYLKPNGTMAPSLGTICLAPITDSSLWAETMQKARFWQQPEYYSIDLTPLSTDAFKEYFSSPVVGCFNPNSIVSSTETISRFDVDFYKITLDEIKNITIPVCWDIKFTGIVHAIAGWFDLEFNLHDQLPVNQTKYDNSTDFMGNAYTPTNDANYSSFSSDTNGKSANSGARNPVTLCTGPNYPPTHWQQVRFLLPEPIAVNYGQRLVGKMTMVVNASRSYDMHLDVNLIENSFINSNAQIQQNLPPATQTPQLYSNNGPKYIRQAKCNWYLHEQIYNYSYNSNSNDYNNQINPENLNLYSAESNNIN